MLQETAGEDKQVVQLLLPQLPIQHRSAKHANLQQRKNRRANGPIPRKVDDRIDDDFAIPSKRSFRIQAHLAREDANEEGCSVPSGMASEGERRSIHSYSFNSLNMLRIR